MLSKLPAGPTAAGAPPISRRNAHSAGLLLASGCRRAGEQERDAVQLANPQKLIWTRVIEILKCPVGARTTHVPVVQFNKSFNDNNLWVSERVGFEPCKAT